MSDLENVRSTNQISFSLFQIDSITVPDTVHKRDDFGTPHSSEVDTPTFQEGVFGTVFKILET